MFIYVETFIKISIHNFSAMFSLQFQGHGINFSLSISKWVHSCITSTNYKMDRTILIDNSLVGILFFLQFNGFDYLKDQMWSNVYIEDDFIASNHLVFTISYLCSISQCLVFIQNSTLEKINIINYSLNVSHFTPYLTLVFN